MKIPYLSMYQRLRDFDVLAAVLDEIFAREEMLNTLVAAWEDLRSEGDQEDEIAAEIAALITKELQFSSDQSAEK